MSKKDEALKLALIAERVLKAWDDPQGMPALCEEMNCLREALAEPERPAVQGGPVAIVAEVHMSRYTIEWTNGPLPEGAPLYTTPQPAVQGEPVAWLYPDNLGRKIVWLGAKKPIIPRPSTAEPLYTCPPASKPWVELTRDEIVEIHNAATGKNIGVATGLVEKKLKEKNA